MSELTDEMRKKLKDAGRQDLIDAFDLTAEGYAGINKNGTIVDRRKFKDAIPIPENKYMGIPKPKEVK